MVAQAVIQIVIQTLVLLPLTFLSSARMQQSLVPIWIQTVAIDCRAGAGAGISSVV